MTVGLPVEDKSFVKRDPYLGNPRIRIFYIQVLMLPWAKALEKGKPAERQGRKAISLNPFLVGMAVGLPSRLKLDMLGERA